MDARNHKRVACGALADVARSVMTDMGNPSAMSPDGWRSWDAWRQLVEELERRGQVVHRAPDPSPDAPALPFDVPIERAPGTE